MLHKIADGSTVAAFFIDWACMTRHQPNKDPEFISMSIVPPNDPQMVPEIKLEMGNNCVTRMFVFENTKISDLKEMVLKSGVKNAMAASSKKSLGHSKPSIFLRPINLCPRTVPPMPENSVGNFAWVFTAMPKR